VYFGFKKIKDLWNHNSYRYSKDDGIIISNEKITWDVSRVLPKHHAVILDE